MTPNNNKKLSTEAKAELWRRGILSWKLADSQKALYDLFYKSNFKTQVWLLARRSGKSYTLCVMALETCLRKPNSIVKFVSPTKKQTDDNIRPLMKKILDDCPDAIKPEFKKNQYIYYFPNGSEIQLAGSESGHAEKLRGAGADLCIVDEAGVCSDLSNLVSYILLPTTAHTRGKVLIAGTPPKESEHDFISYIESAEAEGSLVRKTIYDNSLLTEESREELIKALGGLNSDATKRELLCEIIKDPSTSVIPEFTPELEMEVIKDWIKPTHYDSYEAMDLGFNDLTVILYAYYDFMKNKVIIEDKIVKHGKDLQLPKLVDEIRDKEFKLWVNPMTNEINKPHVRVSDINYIVTQEIYRASGEEIRFLPARKDDKEAAINAVRVMLANRQIIINPRCETLIRHLRNVKWKSANDKKTFARSPDDGHYDGVDSLCYLIRHINFARNPYPAYHGINTRDLFVTPNSNFHNVAGPSTHPADIYKQIFGKKPRN